MDHHYSSKGQLIKVSSGRHQAGEMAKVPSKTHFSLVNIDAKISAHFAAIFRQYYKLQEAICDEEICADKSEGILCLVRDTIASGT